MQDDLPGLGMGLHPDGSNHASCRHPSPTMQPNSLPCKASERQPYQVTLDLVPQDGSHVLPEELILPEAQHCILEVLFDLQQTHEPSTLAPVMATASRSAMLHQPSGSDPQPAQRAVGAARCKAVHIPTASCGSIPAQLICRTRSRSDLVDLSLKVLMHKAVPLSCQPCLPQARTSGQLC